jgi:hypothetical protein
MDRTKAEPKKNSRNRADGRKSLLVYLDQDVNQDVIKQLKKAALDQDRAAYEITEEAVRNWLATYKVSPRRKAG